MKKKKKSLLAMGERRKNLWIENSRETKFTVDFVFIYFESELWRVSILDCDSVFSFIVVLV